MGFYIYARNTQGGVTTYTYIKSVKLYGCKGGAICQLLSKMVPPNQGEPYLWCLRMREVLEDPTWSFIIDLKPSTKKLVFEFFELHQICGYSAYGWTPALLRLRRVLNEDAAGKVRPPHDFQTNENKNQEPIYTVTYFRGSVAKGHMTDTWMAPPQSATNSTLVWPDVLRFFSRCIGEADPGILE